MMHHEWTRTVISTALGLFAAWLCLFVHELGHLVAGMAVGFRFQLLTLGPLRIERGSDGRLRQIDWGNIPFLKVAQRVRQFLLQRREEVFAGGDWRGLRPRAASENN